MSPNITTNIFRIGSIADTTNLNFMKHNLTFSSMSIVEFESDSNKGVQLSITGKILIGITGGLALGITVISAPFVSPALRKICLPFVPATNAQITNILTALKGRQGKVVDLGSGDGRIVLETAKRNFISHGVELNPWLVLYSKVDAYRKGVKGTRFFHKDLWKFDVSQYNNVIIFGVEQMMADLEQKICSECNGDCIVIACRFPLPNVQPARIIGSGIDTVWVYQVSPHRMR